MVETMSRIMPPSTETGMSDFLRKGINCLSALDKSMLKSSTAMAMINVQTLNSEKLICFSP